MQPTLVNTKANQIEKKDFLTINEYTTDEILYLLNEAVTMKKLQKEGKPHRYLEGKVLGMIFEKSSTRTRVSFEVGMLQLGGNALFLSSNDIQLGRGETTHDTAKVLSRYVDGLMIRTFSHSTIEEFATHATVPVINGLTNEHHPCQVLADLLTILEHKGTLKGLKMCFIGDGSNNMSHSLIEGAVKVGMHISVASPEGFEPDTTVWEKAKITASITGSNIEFSTDPVKMIKEADVVITDVWSSMGQENEAKDRLLKFANYQVNKQLTSYARNNYIFLHCLPAHRGEEVTEEIIDGPHSVVFDEAENRLHAQKAILKALMETK
ncbi:ornithine carbamoyltransferase [Sutcliffiella cohnii]